MGGVMAATGAVSGMPVAVAAPVASAFLPGATKRSHRLGSRPVSTRPRAPEPPGAPARARSRSLSPRLEVSLPRPLPGWPPWPPWPPTAGSGRAPASAAGTEQGSWGHPTRGWSPPSPSPPAPRAFTAPSCSIPFVRLRRRPIAPSSDPPTLPGQWTHGQQLAGLIGEEGAGRWGSPEAQVSLCSGHFASPLSPRAGGTRWAGVRACGVVAVREAAESGSKQGFSAGRAA